MNTFLENTRERVEQLSTFAKEHNELWLYGAGIRAKQFFGLLQEMGIAVQGFMVTNGDSATLFGLPVLPASQVQLSSGSGVILAFKGADMQDIRQILGECPDILVIPDEFFSALYYDFFLVVIANELSVYPVEHHLSPLSEWKNIFIVRLDVLGDLIMTTAFIRELRRNCPQSHITLVVRSSNYFLFKDCPYISELILYDIEEKQFSAFPGKREFVELREHMKHFLKTRGLDRRSYDVAIQPCPLLGGRNSLESVFLAFASGAKCQVGRVFSYHRNAEIIYGRFRGIMSYVSYDVEEKHEIDYMLDMLKHCGGTVQHPAMELWVSKEAREFARTIIKENGLQASSLIAVGLEGSIPCKNWPPEKYLAVMEKLLDAERASMAFILLGGKDVELAAHYITENISPKKKKRILDLTGRTNLEQVAAITECCSLYLGADTGLKHMAAALQKPVVELNVALRGSHIRDGAHPLQMGAWGVPSIVLQPSGLDDCSVCCDKPYPHCITQIGVDEVISAVKKLLARCCEDAQMRK